MSARPKDSDSLVPRDRAAQTAAQWVIRRDRGLSEDESRALARWQAADERHAAEFARIGAGWQSLNGLSAVPALVDAADEVVAAARARQRRRRWFRHAAASLATAAVVALGFIVWWRPAEARAPVVSYQVMASNSRVLTLPDGSIATLNGDCRIEPGYTPDVRRVRLLAGEAHFTVKSDLDRPFLVEAGPVRVRAVGTAFNVRLAASAVEVLVTEGRVRVDNRASGVSLLPAPSAEGLPSGQEGAEPVLQAGERVVVSLASIIDARAQVQVSGVAPGQIDELLAWQSTRLVFSDTPLDEVVAAFNRHNDRLLVLGDASLRARRITGTFRADNLDGFLRLLEAGVDVRAENTDPGSTVLRPAH